MNPNEAFYDKHRDMLTSLDEDSIPERVSESEFVEAPSPGDIYEMADGRKVQNMDFQVFDPINIIEKKKKTDLDRSFYSD